ncbi:MAG: tRNA pseudouridine(55) synthase TruB [Desulfobacterales bacterium]
MTAKAVNGVLVLDKPEGKSSAWALAQVKRRLGARKAGHAGTLDPFATGVLVCCLGRATRLARFFLHGHKRYEAVLKLGVETDTQDPSGRITASAPVPELSEADITAVFRRFEGEIDQEPPAYSALKQDGVPLYRLARAGRPVQKPPRKVRIQEIRLLNIALPAVRFEVACSAGTYIRTLCADIGRVIGCGAHLKQLRRTVCNGFGIEEAVTLDRLSVEPSPEAALIQPAEALRGMPSLMADPETVDWIRNGKPLLAERLRPISRAGEEEIAGGYGDRYAKVLTPEGHLLAVIRSVDADSAVEYCCVFPEA